MKKIFQKPSDLFIRFAEHEDLKDLFIWRNDEETRKASFNTDEININDHKIWFKESLANPNINIFIICDKQCNKLGQIRFDKNKDTAEIDITTNPKYRNQRIGTLALCKLSNVYINNFNVKRLVGKVKKDNIASLKAFEKAGFKVHKEHDEYLELWYEK